MFVIMFFIKCYERSGNKVSLTDQFFLMIAVLYLSKLILIVYKDSNLDELLFYMRR